MMRSAAGWGRPGGGGVVGAPAPPARRSKQPTATGTGGAAASVDPLATKAAIDVLQARRQRLRRRDRRGERARRRRAVLLRHRRRRVHDDPRRPHRQDHDARLARDGARGDAAELVLHRRRAADGRAVPVNRYSGLSAGVPGTPALWDVRPAPLRHVLARARRSATAPTSRATASPSTRRSSTRRRRTSTYFDDVPSTAAIYLDADGTPRDVGTRSRTPTWPRPTSCSAATAPKRASTAARRRRDRQGRHAPAARRRPPTTRGGPGLMTDADLKRYKVIRARSRRTSTTAATTSGACRRRPPAARPTSRR